MTKVDKISLQIPEGQGRIKRDWKGFQINYPTTELELEPLTIKDIARESGYAVGTVSRALNNHPNVSPAAREKILEIVRRHGFQPNANAKRLKQQASNSVAVVVKGGQVSLPATPSEEAMLDYSLIMQLSALTPEEQEKVVAFVQELIAARPEQPFMRGKERKVAEDVNT